MTPCLHLIGHEIQIDKVNSRAYSIPISFYTVSLSGYIKKIPIIPISHLLSQELHEEKNKTWLQFIMWCVKPLSSNPFVYKGEETS